MDINKFLYFTRSVAKYPGAGKGGNDELAYLALGLNGEAGEVANDVKKILRDLPGDDCGERYARIRKELGDVLWYWVRLCDALDFSPNIIMQQNVDKLTARKAAGTLGGSGARE